MSNYTQLSIPELVVSNNNTIPIRVPETLEIDLSDNVVLNLAKNKTFTITNGECSLTIAPDMISINAPLVTIN